MILCCANAIPLLFEQVQKKGNKHFKNFKHDRLLFLDFSIEDFTLKSSNSRNRIVVIKTYDSCFLLKQPRKNLRPDKLMLQKESLLTASLYNDERLAGHVIEGFGFDEVNTVLFRQYSEHVTSFHDLISDNNSLKSNLFDKLGKMMSVFHNAMQWPYSDLEAYEPLFESTYPSLLFAIDLTKLPFYDISATSQSLPYVNFLAQKSRVQLSKSIASLARKWDKNANFLIHGDVRLDNVLSNSNGSNMLLVDWELAMKGDIAWDISGILYFIVSTYYDFRKRVSSYDNIKANFAPFWRSYSSTIRDQETFSDFKQRIVAYCGVRICEHIIKLSKLTLGDDEQFLLKLGEDMTIKNETYSQYFL